MYYIVKGERRFLYEPRKTDKAFCIKKGSKVPAVAAGPFIFIRCSRSYLNTGRLWRIFNTRVTLDNHLRYCDFCYDLYSKKLNFKSAMPKEQTILEIKYDRFLFKQIQDVLAQCDLSKKPPSKFGTSRQFLKEYYY